MNKWISVADSLPAPGERVLATDGAFVGEAYLTETGRWVRHHGLEWPAALGYPVTHWMGMPGVEGIRNA